MKWGKSGLPLVETTDGEELSMFVDDQLVRYEGTPTREHPVEGRVRVTESRIGETDAVVMLPVSTITHGRFVGVPTKDVYRAAS